MIAEWRRNEELHGWMEKLYLAKGGRDADFNQATLALTGEELDRVEREVSRGALGVTFLPAARAHALAGRSVFYWAWW